MKSLLVFLKTTLMGGLLVVLPVWLTILLVVSVLGKLQEFVQPIAGLFPFNGGFSVLLAVALLLGLCFAVGLGIKTAIGRRTKSLLEKYLLERVPGYAVMRGVAEQLAAFNDARGFRSALAEIEEALVPAFIVEEHADGRFTVFVPSAPTPASGAIYILAAGRVHPINVPLMTMVECISRWGAGTGQLLAAMTTTPSPGVFPARAAAGDFVK
jgi:uncharacterized membrane protein